ncbi:MAG: hypothetical protein K6E36_01830 [Oscillospiraceae bacterium]|nr:hypothetical protein [Oscillospiraceae bacterium]
MKQFSHLSRFLSVRGPVRMKKDFYRSECVFVAIKVLPFDFRADLRKRQIGYDDAKDSGGNPLPATPLYLLQHSINFEKSQVPHRIFCSRRYLLTPQTNCAILKL